MIHRQHRPRLLRTALLLAVFATIPASHGADELPPPPHGGLRDDTRALPENVRAGLIQEMAACSASIGADIWFTAGTFLSSGQNIRLHARDLRQHWSPGRDAVLLSYDRASDSQALSFSAGLWQRYPSVEITAIMQHSAAAMADKSQPLETRVTLALRGLLTDLQALEKQRRLAQITLSRHHIRLAQAVGAGLGGGAVLLGLIGAVARRRDAQAARQSRFPGVLVGTRFGAPHGGGVIVEKPAA